MYAEAHLKYIQTITKPNKKRKEQENKIKEANKNYVTKEEIIKKLEELEKKLFSKKIDTLTKEEISEYKNKIREIRIKITYESHKMCCCKNKKHGHKLWHRDFNSAKNILKVMEKKLKQENLGIFEKPKIIK